MKKQLIVTLMNVLLASCIGTAQDPPNIVLIMADDLGGRDLPAYGNPFNEAPNIDKLASEGIQFSNAYAAPVCSPTRASIQSGQYPARVGIFDFIPGHWRPFERLIVPVNDDHLPHELTTPGEALAASGYRTGYFGKWHLGHGPEHAPDQHGYQVTDRQLGKEFQQWRQANGRLDRGPKAIDLLTDQTIYFIEQNTRIGIENARVTMQQVDETRGKAGVREGRLLVSAWQPAP